MPIGKYGVSKDNQSSERQLLLAKSQPRSSYTLLSGASSDTVTSSSAVVYQHKVNQASVDIYDNELSCGTNLLALKDVIVNKSEVLSTVKSVPFNAKALLDSINQCVNKEDRNRLGLGGELTSINSDISLTFIQRFILTGITRNPACMHDFLSAISHPKNNSKKNKAIFLEIIQHHSLQIKLLPMSQKSKLEAIQLPAPKLDKLVELLSSYNNMYSIHVKGRTCVLLFEGEKCFFIDPSASSLPLIMKKSQASVSLQMTDIGRKDDLLMGILSIYPLEEGVNNDQLSEDIQRLCMPYVTQFALNALHYSLLHYTCLFSMLTTFRSILPHYIEGQLSSKGPSPVFCAIGNGSESDKFLDLLIESGVDRNYQKKKSCTATPLLSAVYYRDEKVAFNLINDELVNPNLRSTDKGCWTALMIACKYSSNDRIALELVKRKDVDIHAVNYGGITAWSIAKSRGLISVVNAIESRDDFIRYNLS